MKIVFMGTPDFAVGALESIIEAGQEITAVVTQPDKAKGRSGQMQFPPVKECALKHGIEVFQPVKIKTEESVNKLREYDADVFVVVAFGQLLSQEILDMPKYGCVNIHASLLPKYRGAAPIQRVIIDGEKETGVTTMRMDVGLDTGDMMLKEAVTIDEKETGESLHDKLSVVGSSLIVKTLELLEKDEIIYEKQDDSLSCYAKMLNKELGHIDWSKRAVEIERLIRGLNSWPSAYTSFQGKTLKLWEADVRKQADDASLSAIPGTVVDVTKEEITVACGCDFLVLKELQLEGKKRMTTKEFLLGRSMELGTVLG